MQALVAAHHAPADRAAAIASATATQHDDLDLAAADLAEQARSRRRRRSRRARRRRAAARRAACRPRCASTCVARGAIRTTRIASPRAGGEHVVAHVADDGQRVRVRARRGGALVLEQPLPALAAHERREPVERDRADQRRQLRPGVRAAAAPAAWSPTRRRRPSDSDRDGEADQQARARRRRRGAGGGGEGGAGSLPAGVDRSGDRERMTPQPRGSVTVSAPDDAAHDPEPWLCWRSCPA